MKQVIILHGTGETPKSFWFPYLKRALSKDKYSISIPQLPDTNNLNLKTSLPFVLKKYSFNSKTILIGHSAGCPLILSVLENIEITIDRVILVAGFVNPLDGDDEPILKSKYNWSKIKKHSKKFIFINSVDDPWGCNDKQGRKMFDKLGGTLIVFSNNGHMGSDTFEQPYKKFPLVRFLIENKS